MKGEDDGVYVLLRFSTPGTAGSEVPGTPRTPPAALDRTHHLRDRQTDRQRERGGGNGRM